MGALADSMVLLGVGTGPPHDGVWYIGTPMFEVQSLESGGDHPGLVRPQHATFDRRDGNDLGFAQPVWPMVIKRAMVRADGVRRACSGSARPLLGRFWECLEAKTPAKDCQSFFAPW